MKNLTSSRLFRSFATLATLATFATLAAPPTAPRKRAAKSGSSGLDARPARPRRPHLHSLRVRLALWYGGLLAVALSIFGFLILVLATNSIQQSVTAAIQAHGRVTLGDVRRQLTPIAPYWPDRLNLAENGVSTNDVNSIVEIRDVGGFVRYPTRRAVILPLNRDVLHAVRGGQTQWYVAKVPDGRVQVEAIPIRAPANAESGAPQDTSPVIGVLLVGRSLDDVDNDVQLLRTLLLVTGTLTLAGALAGGWAIAGRVLRPLAEIGATARAIVATTARGTRLGNLSRRIRRPSGNDEMVQVVDTLNGMLAALESATQVQLRFVADASHELRAPLTTVQGNLAFLLRRSEELPLEERRAMLDDAHGEALRLARLVDDLLMLARADAQTDDHAPLDPETVAAPTAPPDETASVELDHAILQLVRQFRRLLATEGPPLTVEVGRIEPVRVRGDEESLRRVALILLDNAIKYTPAHTADTSGPTGSIKVALERIDGQAVLSVRDTGMGIDRADLPHIFERFYRADRARSRQGTGLGLSIAQALVEQMGGRITAESVPGEGSTFSVWLPLA